MAKNLHIYSVFTCLLFSIEILGTEYKNSYYDYEAGVSYDLVFETRDTYYAELKRCEPNSSGKSFTVQIPKKVSLGVGSSKTYSVLYIGSSAFSGNRYISNVEIPEGVISIGRYAFSGCTGLTQIDIPLSIKTVDDYAFSGCISLSVVKWNSEKCDSFYLDSNIFNGCTSITEFTFGNGVKVIPSYCCNNLKGLTSVRVPKSVVRVGERAFYQCDKLKEVEWDATKCADIYDANSPSNDYKCNIFEGCPIEKFTFGEGVEYIPSGCCYNFNLIKDIIIPASVKSIGTHVFDGCVELSSITVDEKNPVYDSRDNCNAIIESNTINMLYGCVSTVFFPSLKSINQNAFEGCSKISNLIWNAESCTVPKGTFSKCKITKAIFGEYTRFVPANICFEQKDLSSVLFSTHVISIGASAFSYCSNLSAIYILGKNPPDYGDSFYGVNRDIPVYVTRSTNLDYSSELEWHWKSFNNIIKMDYATRVDGAYNTLEVSSIGETYATIVWQAHYDAASYIVEIKTHSGYIFTRVFDATTGALLQMERAEIIIPYGGGFRGSNVGNQHYSYAVGDLSENTTYNCNVRCVDLYGNIIDKYDFEFTTHSEITSVSNSKEKDPLCERILISDKKVSLINDDSNIRVYDLCGRLASNPVPNSGIYVVSDGAQTTKICVP